MTTNNVIFLKKEYLKSNKRVFFYSSNEILKNINIESMYNLNKEYDSMIINRMPNIYYYYNKNNISYNNNTKSVPYVDFFKNNSRRKNNYSVD